MRLLVIGAEGQLARALSAANHKDLDVVARGRPLADLRLPKSLERAIDVLAPSLVINGAAYTAVDRAEQEPELAWAINAEGAGHLARACAAARVPLIHVSTDYVFDGTKSSAYVEDDAICPINGYGLSKAAGERAVAQGCARHLIVRTSRVHSGHGSNFVATMLKLAGERPRLRVVDDQIGSPTYAPHLAHALLTMARRVLDDSRPFCDWGTYHAAGSGGATTWCGLAREALAVAAWLGAPAVAVDAITTADYPTPARRPANSRLDCRRLNEVFGIELPDWRMGVALSVGEIVGRQRLSKAA